MYTTNYTKKADNCSKKLHDFFLLYLNLKTKFFFFHSFQAGLNKIYSVKQINNILFYVYLFQNQNFKIIFCKKQHKYLTI